MSRQSSVIGQAKTALRLGVMVKDGKHYRYYRPSRRRFSGETIRRLTQEMATDRVEALTAKTNDEP